jgi:methyl-accepting chemotaxis protein
MNPSDLKIRSRLYLGFGAMVVLLTLLVALAYNNFSKLADANSWNIHTFQVLDAVVTCANVAGIDIA